MASPESTSARDQAGSAPSNAPLASPQQGPSSQFTNGLLMASGTAFLAGIFGSLWYQGRQDKRKGLNRIATPAGPSLQSLNDLKMAESLIKEGRLLGLKAFGIATTLCISGAVLVVGTTRWALDVETIPEFSAKMRDLFPKQKTKFVDAVVGADRSMFGTSEDSHSSSSSSSASAGSSEEKDLDHEDDVNILGRIERELRKLEREEQEEASSLTSTSSASS
ncbi:MAG: hypothetical protein BYD32DRAFT_458351 [Podila humilis]|nr:MAG: hypothetical protein BYD32DRAFT_458351 [Podila humilis]